MKLKYIRIFMGELAIRNNYGAPSEHEMMVFQTMAKAAVESKMYRGIGDQAGVMMIMLSARELGIPPCQALNGGINIINGKAEISARMMSALIRKSGHEIKIKNISDASCTLVGKRSDTGESEEATFTIEDAQKAGLVKPNGGWTKCPKDMCFARSLSRLARQLFSDVIGIGYVEGEIKASDVELVVPDDILPEIPENPQEDEINLHKLLDIFDKEDQFLLMEYMEVVMKHFGWSRAQCVNKFLEEKSLIDKFSNWKSKRKVA
jgi:hypothetical protein